MSKPFTVEASLDGISPLKDGGMSVRFHTQEISKDEMVEAMQYYQTIGHMLFSPNEIELSDIPDGNAYLDSGKSPSKRMRDRMFVFYKQKGLGNPEGFNAWYERQLEKVGQQYLDGIDR